MGAGYVVMPNWKTADCNEQVVQHADAITTITPPQQRIGSSHNWLFNLVL
jgi:hypothetical protein